MQPGKMSRYTETLARCSLFYGIAEKEIEAMLGCLGARIMEYEKNETILWEDDEVIDIGIVLSGHARSVKGDISGKTVIVTLLERGSLIGILLSASRQRKSPVSVQALEHLIVMFIPMEKVLKRCANSCERHDRLLRNVMDSISEKALLLHDRNDCLIKPTIREKVMTYLSGLAKVQKKSTLTLPFDRNAMAEYLNVDRSALSRELSKMKKDGLIDYYKNNFKLLNSAF